MDEIPGNNNGNSNNPNGNGGSGTTAAVAGSGLVGGGTSAAAAKNQLEQLNTMREALFSQDGWGCQHVNQDTNWDVPGSPEPPKSDRVGDSGGPPMWKPNINNGTDLWEANLRNGGQPPPQPVQKTPWGHTPSTNLGGTWGEDDDGSDTSNVWTGTPTNPVAPQWTQPTGNLWPPTAPGAVAVAAAQQQKKETDWGSSIGTGGAATAGSGNNAWGDPRDIRGPAPIDIRNTDPRELRPANDLRLIDPRNDAIRDMRGDPRGISGRLNGTSEMWGQHHTLTHGQIPVNKMVGPAAAVAAVAAATGGGAGPVAVVGANNSQWGVSQPVTGGGPKDIAMAGVKPTGWEEPSPPAQRRNIPNYDDGTSLWGQQQRVSAGVSHWKDIEISRNHMIRGAIGNQGGAPGVGTNNATPIPQGVSGGRHGSSGPNNQIKPEQSMWSHAGQASRNNGAWGDDQHGVGGGGGNASNWEEKSAAAAAAAAAMGNIGGGGVGVGVGGGGWNDATASSAWKNQNKSQIWPDSDLASDWGGPHGVGGNINKPPQSKLGGVSSDLIRTSKQYRMLVDLGFKKEDVELTLRASNLNVEEAHDLLITRQNAAAAGLDSWRRDDPSSFVVGSGAGGGGGFDHTNAFTGRFPGSGGPPPSMQFPPVQKYINQGSHSVSGAPNLPGGFGGGGQGGVVQGGTGAGGQAGVGAGGVGTGNHNSGQPSAQQLRMLVQQIQMAVQGGFLSGQILNQPLAPTTLILLNQLLTSIKHLQGAQTNMQRNPMNNMQLSLAIAKYKNQITNLQSQINAQQAMYVKQQQQQAAAAAAASSHVGSSNNEYLRGPHDAISALQSNFSEISLNKTGAFQGAPNPQSRLNQWKLPVLEKEVTSDSTDFSRAPGPTVKSTLSTATNANNSMGTLGLQGDVSTWSSARNLTDGWPSDPNNENESKDWPAAQPSPATAFTDLVPEFEPGKPWKGTQMKNIEDDPSITPGSVARSPLSINPTAKDADLFANSSKTSPTDLPPLSLSSTTWSFNPTGNQPNFSGWSDNISQSSATTSELWGAPMNKSSRGPPPGLGSNKSSVGLVGQGSGGVGVGMGGVSQGGGVAGNGSGVGPSGGVGGVSNSTGSSNGWIGSSLTGRVPNSAAGVVPAGSAAGGNSNWSTANSNWHSTWLLLKNLTTQIDGSTLRTLCMQHGPLQNFHLYLNQGIALCKYSTREEANKAQMALNSCVLGNTTICAESPNESEVQSILQHLPAVGGGSQSQSGGSNNNNNTGGGNSSGGGGGGGGNLSGAGLVGPSVSASGQSSWRPQNQPNQSRSSGSDTWGAGSVWPSPNATANLWTSPLDGTTERGTPSNLKSFLPENLLELN